MKFADWRQSPVVGIGLVNVDYVAVTQRWERDRKTEASQFIEQVGGPVPVALCAFARLDAGETAAPLFFSTVGTDSVGTLLTDSLTADGVDIRYVRRDAEARSSRSLVVLDTSDGSRTLTNWQGVAPPLLPFTPGEEAALASAGLLHVDGRDLDACLYAARTVKAGGGIVSFDLGTMRPGRDALIAVCDIVIASQRGGAGAFPELADDPVRQVRRFLKIGIRVAGVTLGARGCVVAARDENGGEPTHLPAFTVPGVVDTCGAGDLFHGAFLWAYRAGYTAKDAAQFAQAAVALRIRHLGNRAGQPGRAAVEAFLGSQVVISRP